MKSELKELILYETRSASMLELWKKAFFYHETAMLCNYRKAQAYTKSRNLLMKTWWNCKWLHIRKKTYCQVSLKAEIGKGLRFLHDGPRIVVFGAKIGKDCTMGINTTIGMNYPAAGGEAEFPTIGDRVYIGHNATIVGGITVGSDVVIACNAFVNKDVPDHSIVVGNNVIIHQKNPSLRFLDLYPSENKGEG